MHPGYDYKRAAYRQLNHLSQGANMTITANRYFLAIAMTILPCVSNLKASNSSMKQDLIKIYEEEQQLIEEKKLLLQKADEGDVDPQNPFEEPYDNVLFPLELCQKYLSILKHTITSDNISTLEHEYNKYGNYSEMLEVKYLSSVLAAIYFDLRDEKEARIHQAMATMVDQQPSLDMTRRERAINYYIRAKICKQLSVESSGSEAYYAQFLNAGISENSQISDDTPSLVLDSLFEELKNCSFS